MNKKIMHVVLNATPRQGVGGDGDGESMESPLRGGDTGTKIGIK